jgi:hypothetical protein
MNEIVTVIAVLEAVWILILHRDNSKLKDSLLDAHSMCVAMAKELKTLGSQNVMLFENDQPKEH